MLDTSAYLYFVFLLIRCDLDHYRKFISHHIIQQPQTFSWYGISLHLHTVI